MEALVVALGALETKAVDLGVKALAKWEVVLVLGEDMEMTLETWVVGRLAVADLVVVLSFSFQTSLRSWPM